ncbi:MAG: serine/threonine-protein phosphatase, partial [Gemmatimonadetes bacterium]|nr:serine/threonine-protein phosphatase [Gemmatimonadota bacterium]
ENVIGLLYSDNRSVLPFKEDDLKLLTLIGHFAAIKIRETIMTEEVARQKKLEEEMRLAAEIQQNLLPKQKMESSAVTVYGENIPSFEVGGDYFDYFPQRDGQVWAALGDVSGKGLSAAMLMSNLHAMLRAHVEASPRLADLTARLNDSVFRTTHGERFITLFLARFDPATGEGAYVNAGHNPPFLLRKDGSIDTLEEGGLFLGSFPECTYDRGTFTLGEGETLLLYSDGITEGADESGEMFGEDRLAAFLRAHAGEEPDVFVPKLLDTVFAFCENRDPGDDATVLVLKRR